MAKALLDTSAVIGLFAGEPAVVSAVERQQQLFLPVIALGELYYGAFRSARRANNNARLDAGEKSLVTGSDGKFSFVVPAGTYRLRELPKLGFGATFPFPLLYTLILSSGQSATGKNFGNRQLV